MLELPKTLGKYRINSVLGQGAMGVVYQAMDPDIERLVAIKVIHAHLLQGDRAKPFLQRFRREAQAAARCLHANIVTVYELGRDGERDYIVMEYVQGQELKYFMDREHRFSQEEALYIIGEVLKALSAAHKHGVVHRDIKPANVILLDNGGVKVADFGVARTQQSDLTVSGNMVGTPGYMSPEGLMGQAVDHRADIYSTGMMLLELLAGDKPSSAQRFQEKVEDFLLRLFAKAEDVELTPGMKYLLHRSLAEDKEKRFKSSDDFLKAMEQVQKKHAVNDRQVAETLSESVTRELPAHKQAGEQAFHWTPELLEKLERELTDYVGPLAGMLIKKSVSDGLAPMDMVERLASHIQEEKDRDAFVKKARLCMAIGSCADPGGMGSKATGSHLSERSSGGTLSQTLTPEQMDQLIHSLANHVGPLARQMVRMHARRFSRIEELHEKLADSIPDSAERREFLRSVSAH